MAELADAHGSGPCDSNIMRVQVPFPACLFKSLKCLIIQPFKGFFFSKNLYYFAHTCTHYMFLYDF